jgi:hypothetical protein
MKKEEKKQKYFGKSITKIRISPKTLEKRITEQ